MESMTVPASMDYLYRVLAQIGLLLERENCPENERRLIEISTEELFTNISSYAYKDQAGLLQVEYGVADEEGSHKRVLIRFKDKGSPFDPFAKEDPDLSLSIDERPVGGLGIYMVKMFMDQVRYQYADGWNITVIEKQFAPVCLADVKDDA